MNRYGYIRVSSLLVMIGALALLGAVGVARAAYPTSVTSAAPSDSAQQAVSNIPADQPLTGCWTQVPSPNFGTGTNVLNGIDGVSGSDL